MIKFNASCGCYIGDGRENNQDNFYFFKKHMPSFNKGLKNPLKYSGNTDDIQVFGVFDGMGGEHRGEEAAFMACEVFAEEHKRLEQLALSGKEFIYKSCDEASRRIYARSEELKLNGMGTTAAVLYFSQDEVVAGNVGDSRIFRIRNKKMVQISEDHTDERLLSTMGINKKPVLLQYLGIPDTEMEIVPYVTKGNVENGDIYVICSDGVTDVLNINELYKEVSVGSADTSVSSVIACVRKKNGKDNTTVTVIKFD